MTDPSALRVALSRYLRVRVSVRALAARLAATEHAMQQNARRSEEPATIALLTAQLGAQRAAFDTLGAELDVRIAEVGRACRALETAAARDIITHARGDSGSLRTSR